MEKLNIRILKVVVASALVAISSSAGAGDFRMSSKSPVTKAPVRAQEFKGYIYGYGGIDFGASYETMGAFDHPEYFDCECVPFDPTAVPINFDLNNGWTAGGGLGRYSGLFGGSRFELEGSYTSNNVGYLDYADFNLPADFRVSTKAVMFNMLKEIPLGHATGYIGGGVGYASSRMVGDIATIEYDDSDSGFAWQFIMGIDIPITDRLALFTQYRYMVLADSTYVTDFGDFSQTTLDNPASHAVVFGARVSF
ncbi:MAG: porin family protein [Verrucomicrobiales bacterium]|jgi:opacity protein-like surface antigen|nr:porin family protein [Verrucomicrobiales bacterium]MBP9224025.1 porin family protein [Verrucomicrobiales bacterium]HQZ28326.1 outer membrane beta-barrel protein [Verrucomicrobiales bacterium]